MFDDKRYNSFCICLLCLVVGQSSASAQIAEWDGGGGDPNWTNQFNWNPDAIPSGVMTTVVGGPAVIMSQPVSTVLSLEVGRPGQVGTMKIEGNTGSGSIQVAQSTAVRPLGSLELSAIGANTATLITGPVSNEGSILVGNNGLINTLSAPYVQSNGQTTLDGGQILAPITHIMNGSLAGEGEINGNLILGGTPSSAVPQLSPGNGIGRLDVSGSLQLRRNSHLNIEIDGSLQKPLADRIVVDGNVTLGGTLNLNLVAGTIPIDKPVSIITAGSFSPGSNFQEITGFETPNGGLIVVLDTTQSVPVVCIYEYTEKGDMNGDGSVDNLDATLFGWAVRDLESYNERYYDSLAAVPCHSNDKLCGAAPRLAADMDGDRRWTSIDVYEFLEKVEQTEGSSAYAKSHISSILSGETVPEPQSLCLLNFVLLYFSASRRHSHAILHLA